METGSLQNLLNDKTGLKLAQLPKDSDQIDNILDEIINSGVPIALWFSAIGQELSEEDLKNCFDSLLEKCDFTNFAALAKTWQTARIQLKKRGIEHLRLLCDCPDRLPHLPDLNQEEDLLVAP